MNLLKRLNCLIETLSDARRQLLTFSMVFAFSAWRITNFFEHQYFYAEDLVAFFIQSIELGPTAIITPYSHHLLLQRIIAFGISLAPVKFAPYLYQISGGIISSICISTFSRSGFAWIVRRSDARVLICIFLSLIHGFDPIFFTVCNLYYPIGFAIALLLIEKKAEWCLSTAKVFLVSFLWFSCGFAVVFLPFLFLMYFVSKNRNYLLCGITLLFSALLNLLSFSEVALGGESFPSGTFTEVILAANIFIRTLFFNFFLLPIFGRTMSLKIDTVSTYWFFLSVLFLVVGVFIKRKLILENVKKHARNVELQVLLMLCLTACFNKVLFALVRDYGVFISFHPILTLDLHFSIFPCVMCLLLGLWLIEHWHGKKVVQLIFSAILVFNLTTQNYFALRERRDPRFEHRWLDLADEIQSALDLNKSGQLHHKVVIRNIPCWPLDWPGNKNSLSIKPG